MGVARIRAIVASCHRRANRLLKNGCSEGRSPFDGGLGVSPRYNFHPLPGQEGGRGMVGKGFPSPC